jgi:hypothetical protein
MHQLVLLKLQPCLQFLLLLLLVVAAHSRFVGRRAGRCCSRLCLLLVHKPN